MIKVGIIGGAGYTGGELIRILVNHPEANLSFVQSNSYKGKKLYTAHNDLIGDTELKFTADADYTNIDIVFLCMGHGKSKEYLENNIIPDNVKIIDLSNDFRIASPHHHFVYGLPELQKEKIKTAKHIANPGCFATAIQLMLLPLAKENLVHTDITLNAITGSTGAGQAPSPTTHTSWRNNNLSVYKAFTHQHLAEIYQSMNYVQPNFNQQLNFIPIRGNHTRGILATAILQCNLTSKKIIDIYSSFYADAPFTFVSHNTPDLKQVVNTNKAIVYIEKNKNYVMLISIIDNLLKGASGQAVQNMNLLFGLKEESGLKLKSIAF